jgi:hypothetical protein
VDGDDVTVLDAQVVTDDPVDASAAVIQVVVGQDDQDGVLPLLAADKDGVATEELESLHGVVRKGDDGVVIVDGIRDHQLVGLLLLLEDGGSGVIFLLPFGTRRVAGLQVSMKRASGKRKMHRVEDTYVRLTFFLCS